MQFYIKCAFLKTNCAAWEKILSTSDIFCLLKRNKKFWKKKVELKILQNHLHLRQKNTFLSLYSKRNFELCSFQDDSETVCFTFGGLFLHKGPSKLGNIVI